MAKCIICREYLHPSAYRSDAADAEVVEAHGYKPNNFVKRLLAKIPCKCYVCKEEVSRAELEEHESQCLTEALKKQKEKKDDKPAEPAAERILSSQGDLFSSQDSFDFTPFEPTATSLGPVRSLEDDLLSPKSLDFVKQFTAFDLCEQLPIQTAILLPPPPVVPSKYMKENKPRRNRKQVIAQDLDTRTPNQRALERLRARAPRFSAY